MKILKQLTLESEAYTFKLVADYHHVDAPEFADHTGYTQETIYEAFSYDQVSNLGELMAHQAKVTFTNLFSGNAKVPLVESYAFMNNRRR